MTHIQACNSAFFFGLLPLPDVLPQPSKPHGNLQEARQDDCGEDQVGLPRKSGDDAGSDHSHGSCWPGNLHDVRDWHYR